MLSWVHFADFTLKEWNSTQGTPIKIKTVQRWLYGSIDNLIKNVINTILSIFIIIFLNTTVGD